MSSNQSHPRLGDVFLMKFGGHGCEQNGWRPGLVFQNNVGNLHSPNIIALPLTSNLKKLTQPTHVFVPSEGTGLLRDSMVLCENPECMSKERMGDYITSLPEKYMKQIAAASLLATSAIYLLDDETLLTIREKAYILNQEIA